MEALSKIASFSVMAGDRMKHGRHLFNVVLVAALAVLGVPKSAPGDIYYAFTPIIPLNPAPTGVFVSTATGINDLGQVVGFYQSQSLATYGFLLSGNVFTPIVEGQLNEELWGINNAGQIVGNYEVFGIDRNVPFLYSGGVATTLVPPASIASKYTTVFGLNNNGSFVGRYGDNISSSNGFYWSGSSATSIAFPGSSYTDARGINDSGDIVGIYDDSAYVLSPTGSFSSFSFPGALGTDGLGINNAGQIVGAYQNSMGMPHGFLLSNGVATSINYPGSIETAIFGINDSGDIVGNYEDQSGRQYGFVATPCISSDPNCTMITPEPSLFAISFAILLVLSWRRLRMTLDATLRRSCGR
jgi:probable HAF family extracellular repeat protein